MRSASREPGSSSSSDLGADAPLNGYSFANSTVSLNEPPLYGEALWRGKQHGRSVSAGSCELREATDEG